MKGNDEIKYNIIESVKQKISKEPEYISGFFYSISNKAATTRKTYVSYVLKFLRYSNKSVVEINIDDINRYLEHIKYKNSDDGGVILTSSTYQIAVYSALLSFFKYLYNSRIISANPMEMVDKPNKIAKQRKNIILTVDEIPVVYENIRNGVGSSRAKKWQTKSKERDELIIRLLLSTGIRQSALRQLNIEDVNLENKTITVIEKGYVERVIPISDKVIPYFEAWMKKRDKILAGKRCDALFISGQCRRMHSNTLANIVKKYCSIDGEKTITPHKLRGTYGNLLYNKTHDIYLTQACMGHKSAKTTEIYVEQSNDKLVEAAGIVGDVVL